MEFTKKDQKHIEEETRKVIQRIKIEATEYAQLYEIEYLSKLKSLIDAEIDAKQYIRERSLEISNTKCD